MACSYCDYPVEYCRCRKTPCESSHRSHKRTHGHSRSWRDERSLGRSRCRSPHDYHESRPRSRLRRYSDGQLSSCEYCEEEVCHRGRTPSFRVATHPIDCSQYGYDACGFEYSTTNSRHDKDKSSKDTEQTLRVQLFEAKKKSKKYEEATDVYRDALSHDKTRGSSDRMLKLKASFADMQVTQGNCTEAERVLDDILKWKDLPGGLKSQCTGIHGKLLCERKRYVEAESLYRKLYDRASKDEVSLEMGDEMCNAIALQGDLDRAHIEHTNLVEKRKKILGAGHPATVKSANKAVGNIRKLIQKLSKDYEPEGQRNWKRKQALEADIEYLLRDIWGSLAGSSQKQEADTLKIGFELGLSLSNQNKFYQAEGVLQEVWKGRKTSFGEMNKDTLSTGICLSQAMYRQELDGQSNDQEAGRALYHRQLDGIGFGQELSRQTDFGGLSKSQTALYILQPIWEAASNQAYGDMHSIARAASAHLGVLFARLQNYPYAEIFLSNTASFASTEAGVLMPPAKLIDFARRQMNATQSSIMWDPKSRKSRTKTRRNLPASQVMANGILVPNGRLARAYSPQFGQPFPWAGPTTNHLAITAGPVNAPRGSRLMIGQSNTDYHKQALHEGRPFMAMRDYSRAAEIFRDAWNTHATTPQGNSNRATCGDKYGACLNQLGKLHQANRVLEEVRTLKRQIGLTGRHLRATDGLLGRARPSLLPWY